MRNYLTIQPKTATRETLPKKKKKKKQTPTKHNNKTNHKAQTHS